MDRNASAMLAGMSTTIYDAQTNPSQRQTYGVIVQLHKACVFWLIMGNKPYNAAARTGMYRLYVSISPIHILFWVGLIADQARHYSENM